MRPGHGPGGARPLPPPGPNFPATLSLAPCASLPHRPSPATAARPNPGVPPRPSNLSDPVPRPALRPPGKLGRAGAGRAALRPRHCRPAPPARAKLARLGAEAGPGGWPRSRGRSPGAPTPTPPGEKEQSSPRLHSPPGAPPNLQHWPDRSLARRSSGTSVEGRGGGGGAALASQRQN